jgi:hypothetical protein
MKMFSRLSSEADKVQPVCHWLKKVNQSAAELNSAVHPNFVDSI